MENQLAAGCVIMASGLSRRFGSNKLLAEFCGQPMLCRAFAATDTQVLAARIVVTRSAEVKALCEEHGVPVLLHSLPGRNDTVRLGLTALLEQVPGLFGCMFLPGDQPLLCRETVEAMIGISGWDHETRLERQKKQNGRSSVSGIGSKMTQIPLSEAPFCLSADIFPSCAPCRRARAAMFCSRNTRNMFIRSTLRTGMSWQMPTRPKRWQSWKHLPGGTAERYAALSSFGSSTFSRMATNAAGTMPDSPQISWKACGACARMPLLAPMP